MKLKPEKCPYPHGQCEAVFNVKVPPSVGNTRCTRDLGHRGKHKAPATWGSVEWAEKKPPVLTKAQLDMLTEAAMWTDHPDFDGTGARGSRVRTAAKLESLGLIEYVSHGRREDDDNGDAEAPIYAITAAGRALLPSSPPRDERTSEKK